MKRLRQSVSKFYECVLGFFIQEGEINGFKFQANLLPVHSEYYVAKVVTLITHLFNSLPANF
ncbi:MAG: hypothetical protein N2482_03115 [Patescibacteria group bacterium]|nr:hypothetical protein [Patescibacteria group bacterium]